MSSTAFIFPGQGAQFVGMGKELADAFASARAVFEEVDDALGESFSKLIWEGSEDVLKLTANTQPALMAVSLAAVRALEAEYGVSISTGKYVAGHSLGEYSALAAAGALSVGDAAKMLRYRGEAMQKAVPAGEGAMAALLGATLEQAEAACEASGGVCEIANDNAPGQVVLSGAKAAVEKAAEWSKENGIKKAVLLPVSAPFHCSLMQPAADAMAAALADIALSAPSIPVFANVTAAPATDPDTIRQLLVDQVTARVRWRESVENMAGEGITDMVECGAGKVLTVMNRRTVKSLNGVALGTPEDLEKFASAPQQD
ncbi:MAG: [acyl-carrier-protein] S-malonyltransferase [Ponticaulis sp.]|nr:[acyl-carrier-protein] S-malonyltransferase [Ponticaulis sp.]|tara:strand:- start:43422 stop:44366 length:945 start_codon:yes stop_codon:yes gene_type:complete